MNEWMGFIVQAFSVGALAMVALDMRHRRRLENILADEQKKLYDLIANINRTHNELMASYHEQKTKLDDLEIKFQIYATGMMPKKDSFPSFGAK